MSDKDLPAWERQLKRDANRRKKETGQTLGHVYEAMAKEAGFKTYAAMRAALKAKHQDGTA